MLESLQPIVVHRGPRQNFEAVGFAAVRKLAIVAYVDDARADQRSTIDGLRVVDFAVWRDHMRGFPNIVTALDPVIRRAMVERIAAEGGAFVAVDDRPGSGDGAVSRSATFGEGTLVGDGPLYIGSLTAIGRHAIIMTPTSVAHDIVIGNFVTIYPSAAISGHVRIEDDVVIRVGAVIVNGASGKPLRIGRGALIDVGAVVTKSVPASAIVSGNPARPRQRTEDKN